MSQATAQKKEVCEICQRPARNTYRLQTTNGTNYSRVCVDCILGPRSEQPPRNPQPREALERLLDQVSELAHEARLKADDAAQLANRISNALLSVAVVTAENR